MALFACAGPNVRPTGVEEDGAEDWRRTIEPIVRRSCLPCHAPGGEADIDLSTADRWNRMRSKIYIRTVLDRTMPPVGPLDEAALALLRNWLVR